MIPVASIHDAQRAAFLVKLDGSDLMVTDWEAEFIGSFLGSPRQSTWFTQGRRSVVDKMWMKYGSELKMPFHEAKPEAVVQSPAADPAGCQFLQFLEGRMHPCNVPARFQRQNGFRLCQNHADAVLADLKRRNKTMPLAPFP